MNKTMGRFICAIIGHKCKDVTFEHKDRGTCDVTLTCERCGKVTTILDMPESFAMEYLDIKKKEKEEKHES